MTRDEDDSNLPWVTRPGEADGRGTLIGMAKLASGPVLHETYPRADLTIGSGVYHIIGFDCVPLGSAVVAAFLDDNENAAETDTLSSDPLDACTTGIFGTIPILDGKTTFVAYPLGAPCD